MRELRKTIAASLCLFALALSVATSGCQRGAEAEAAAISPREVLGRLDQDGAPLLLDVRTPEEFASGHVPGAVNIPYDEVGQRSAELAAHRDQEVVVYCEKGGRAAKAAQALADAGFRSIRHLEGDMSGWRAADLPVEKQP
jgi:rhodanese-related sulfurtransferase